ncbi:palmitoyltransferase PFA4 [Eurytemora carolleeae]|uniref:palmitoyltransferase PFA4 n=1 Tax=Eurytemora carolleeae TaxID=1294199 RepID=UPI000C779786|nr:palmitoyltransferase PFA4 [Eurytemora carolleeae]|eukprot:XP_023333589.1 palmitoyltransferase PFA4-like [Eurytemora affinis]
MEFHLMKAKLGSLVREMLSAKSQDLVAEFFLQKVLPAFNAFLIAGITLTTGKLRITDGLSIWMCFFIPIQLILNWIQFYRNRSIISTSTEQFPALVNNMKLNQEYEISINNSQMERYKECYPCNLFVPLRSHHCPYCRKCIYVLDHHCFFLGHCVGRKNMKYFILFCFYAAIGTAYGLYHIMEVMTYYRDVSTKESIYFFFPFIFVMYMFDRAAGFECYYVFLLDFGLGACLICVFLTCMGLYSTFR